MGRGFIRQSLEERREMILHGDILKTLLFLSIPAFLMGVVQALIPIVDSFFLNHTSGYVVAAAVGFVVPIIQMLNGMSGGLGVAGMAMIGNANGRGDNEEVKHLSEQLIVFGFALGLVTAPLCLVSGYVVSKLINPEIAYEVFVYLGLYSFVLPFLFLTAIYNAIKNAIGQPEATLYRMIFLLILKVVFNYLYLSVLDLGTFGSVLGSFSCYLCVGIWMYYDLFVKEDTLKLSLKGFSFRRDTIMETMRLAIPAMLNSITVNLGFVLINLEVQKYGGDVMNSQTIANNVSSIYFLLPASLSTTVTTMVSMNMGLGEKKRAKQSFYTACIVVVAISILIIATCLPFSEPIVRLFQKDVQMVQLAKDAVDIYTLSIIGFGIYMAVYGAFIGLGKTKIPLFTGLLRIWFFRYIFILAFERTLGVYSVFWGNLFSNSAAGLICLLLAMKIEWRTNMRSI